MKKYTWKQFKTLPRKLWARKKQMYSIALGLFDRGSFGYLALELSPIREHRPDKDYSTSLAYLESDNETREVEGES
ncbi:MAG TPA: hypothetical protein VFC84_17185 [Desulfosporosinus sp.]|nr:hypothetical protein [Desulfosporosinus sp.]